MTRAGGARSEELSKCVARSWSFLVVMVRSSGLGQQSVNTWWLTAPWYVPRIPRPRRIHHSESLEEGANGVVHPVRSGLRVLRTWHPLRATHVRTVVASARLTTCGRRDVIGECSSAGASCDVLVREGQPQRETPAEWFSGGGTGMAGLEPATAGFVDRCSIQLSYMPSRRGSISTFRMASRCILRG